MNTLTPMNPTTSPTTGAGNSPNAVNERREPALQPPVDVFEDPTGITLYADLPGVPRENLRLLVDGDRLTIAAEMKLAPVEGLTASHAEVSLSRFRRTFTLSKELDANKVSAELGQGVLRVRIPKADHAQPRKIEVQVN